METSRHPSPTVPSGGARHRLRDFRTPPLCAGARPDLSTCAVETLSAVSGTLADGRSCPQHIVTVRAAGDFTVGSGASPRRIHRTVGAGPTNATHPPRERVGHGFCTHRRVRRVPQRTRRKIGREKPPLTGCPTERYTPPINQHHTDDEPAPCRSVPLSTQITLVTSITYFSKFPFFL